MPIFISYSQKDKEFVDTLAANLIKKKHHIWLDRWELSIGDSLIDKIQSVLTKTSAVIAVISKNSVSSNWCKKEINSSLVRELEESKSLLMPCVIDDCEIPLFLKDKIYADFKKDPDEAFYLLDKALAKISNPQQSRIETPNFYTDWALDWKSVNGLYEFEFVFVGHGLDFPYVNISRCVIVCNAIASNNFMKSISCGDHFNYMRSALELILKKTTSKQLTVLIEDAFEKWIFLDVMGENSEFFEVRISYRRLGQDNGMNTILYIENNFQHIIEHMKEVTFMPKS